MLFRSTDWPRFIGELHTEKFDGYIIFDNKGTFARTPQKLHKVMLELMKACVDEWEENCFNAEEYIGQKNKKLILLALEEWHRRIWTIGEKDTHQRLL